MQSGLVVMISDRPDRGSSICEVLKSITDYAVVGTEESWNFEKPLLGIIADLTLSRPEAKRCLKLLKARHKTRQVPFVYLTRTSSDAILREAHTIGATICLPASSEPRAIVTSLIRQISPNDTISDLVVRRGAARTGSLMTHLFQSAETNNTINMAAIEAGLDPVLNAIHEGGLVRWLDTVWAYDDVTFQHCLLVAGLTAAFAKSLRLSKADQHMLTRAALVHDVGKAKIPLAILNKPGKLDQDEAVVMRTHAMIGYEILSASQDCDAVALAVTRNHHEMLDGSGYPDGLSGSMISDPIRLVTICDIYAALIERRPYKSQLPASEALRILYGMTGKLEHGLVQAFAKVITLS